MKNSRKCKDSHKKQHNAENQNKLVVTSENFCEQYDSLVHKNQRKAHDCTRALNKGMSHAEAVNESGIDPLTAKGFYSVFLGEKTLEEVMFALPEVSEIKAYTAKAMANGLTVPFRADTR